MNIDIQNYGEYRLTSHGGRRFDLFNRKTDEVFTIPEELYRKVMSSGDRYYEIERVYHSCRYVRMSGFRL